MCSLEWLGRLKCWMRLCRLSQRRVGVLGIGRLIVFLFRQCFVFLHNVQVMQ